MNTASKGQWCPNGCGKSIRFFNITRIYNKNHPNKVKSVGIYRCTKCNDRFKKDNLDFVNTKGGYK